MLSKNIIDMMNHQINKEMYSAYLYLNISNYYAEESLSGFSSWFFLQAKEEFEHAKKFIDYLHDNEAKVVLESVESSNNEFKDAREPLELTVKHEMYVTSLINELYRVAIKEEDYRTMNFLSFFINEQCEEEKTAKDLLSRYDIFVSDKRNLYLFDQEMSKRS